MSEDDDAYQEFLRVRRETRDLVKNYKIREKLKAVQRREEETKQERKERTYPFGLYGYGMTGVGGAYSGFPYTFPYQLG